MTWPRGGARTQIEKLKAEYYSSKESLPNLARGKRIDYVIRKLEPRKSTVINQRMHDGTDPLANSASPAFPACHHDTRPAGKASEWRVSYVHHGRRLVRSGGRQPHHVICLRCAMQLG